MVIKKSDEEIMKRIPYEETVTRVDGSYYFIYRGRLFGPYETEEAAVAALEDEIEKEQEAGISLQP